MLDMLATLGGGHSFVDFVSTNPNVRETVGRFLPFAALTPLCGAAAFLFDCVFIGATWTQALRNAGLWSALLIFLAAPGLFQALFYRRLLAVTFPAAQSAAQAPIASPRP